MKHKKLQGGKALEDRISPALFPGTEGLEDITSHSDLVVQPSDDGENIPQKEPTESNAPYLNSFYSDENPLDDSNSQEPFNSGLDFSEFNENQENYIPDQQAFSAPYFDDHDILSADFSNNSHEIWYNDGSAIVADDTGSVVNWDEDGSYHYNGIDGTQCHYHADGSGSYIFPDKSIATWNPDGSGLWQGSDGAEGVYHPNGSGRIEYSDGTSLQWNTEGTIQYIDAQGTPIPDSQFERGEFINNDGSIDVWYDDGTITKTEPDGTTRTYLPDGSGETAYANGAIEIWDSDGTYTYKSSDGIYFTLDIYGSGRIIFADGSSDTF